MDEKKQDQYFHWAKQKLAKGCETIDCPEYDSMKDFHRDPTGFYVLIKVSFVTIRIEVAICNKDHEIVKIFSGRKAQDIYHEIFQYEKKHKVQWLQDKSHIAYLGKELKKAELALVMGNSAYFQE
jgi:hypothetical protein